MRAQRLLWSVPGLLILSVLIAACGGGQRDLPVAAIRPTESPERAAIIATDPDLQEGQFQYSLLCAHCHGYAGEGQLPSQVEITEQLGLHIVPAHDATGHTWQHPTQLIREAILKGIQNPLDHYPMPAYEGSLTDEQIDQIIAYMALWWTDEQREWQAEVTRRHAEIDAELGLSSDN